MASTAPLTACTFFTLEIKHNHRILLSSLTTYYRATHMNWPSSSRNALTLQSDADRTVLESFWLRVPCFYWGILLVCLGFGAYLMSILLSILRLMLLQKALFVPAIRSLMWLSGLPTTIGVLLISIDLSLMLPLKRRMGNRILNTSVSTPKVTVVLTA